MHIYAFGSICRGEVSQGSDIDLLALVEGHDPRFDPKVFSIYSYDRISRLWEEGNPFAWHLWLESRLLFSSSGDDYVRGLSAPAPYLACVRDCEKFLQLFQDAAMAIVSEPGSVVFELSTIFLGIRNLATCFTLGTADRPDFSRNSALGLGRDALHIPVGVYRVLERARLLCTRGYGEAISIEESASVIEHLKEIEIWMTMLIERAKTHERLRQPNGNPEEAFTHSESAEMEEGRAIRPHAILD